jgi:hypothetical protein
MHYRRPLALSRTVYVTAARISEGRDRRIGPESAGSRSRNLGCAVGELYKHLRNRLLRSFFESLSRILSKKNE